MDPVQGPDWKTGESVAGGVNPNNHLSPLQTPPDLQMAHLKCVIAKI